MRADEFTTLEQNKAGSNICILGAAAAFEQSLQRTASLYDV